MIDKRINYRFGGGYQGSSAGPVERGSSGGDRGDRGDSAREARILQQYSSPAPKQAPAKDPDPVTEVVPGDKTFKPVEKYSPNIGPSLHGDMKEPEETLQEMIARQQEEKYGPLADPTKMGETIDKRTQKEKDEDFERAQDWDLIKEMSDKGYDFEEIQSAVEKGLTQKAPTTDRRQNLIDSGLKTIMPETGLERSLLNRAKSFMPDAKTGITSTLKDYFNPGRMATNYALGKMGLSWLNPVLGIASMFGFKNPFANIGTRYTGVPTKKFDIPTDRDGSENVMQAQASENVIETGRKQFSPEHLKILHERYAELQGVIESGEYMGQKLNYMQLNRLADISKQMEAFLVDPQKMMAARGGLARLHG